MRQTRGGWLATALAGAVVASLGPACGSVETGAGGGSTSSSAATGAGGSSSTSSATGSSASSGGGKMCGGIGGLGCAADEFCDYDNDRCGVDDGGGTCQKRPDVCGKNLSSTCGCDGKLYGNLCVANVAGTDANDNGCAPSAGEFACGSHFCALGSQYCQRTTADVGNTPDGFSCVPLPVGCGAAASCACLSAVQCGSMCTQGAEGGLTVVCPGG